MPHLPRNRTVPAMIHCLVLAGAFAFLAWSLGAEGRDAIAERLAADSNVRVIDHAHTWMWRVSVVGAVLLALAAATARWWAGPGGRHPLLPPPDGWTRPTWRWWLAAGVILAAAAWLRAERLDQGIYNDEAYMFRRYIAGQLRPQADSPELRFREASWTDTKWHMQVGNNSPPFGILARLSYERTAKRLGLGPGEVHELSIRMPAFLAGLVGLLVLGWVARRLGSPDHGLLVMALAALHPWLIRYGSEARGHSLVLLFFPLVLGTVILALERGQWRWWIAAGLCSFFLMWAFPGSLYPLVVLNGCLGLFFLHGYIRKPDCRFAMNIQIPRWLLANGLAALLFAFAFLPLWSQLREALGAVPSLTGGPDAQWWPLAAAKAVTGLPWHDPNPDSPLTLSIERALAEGRMFPPLGLAVGWLLAATGFLWWWRRDARVACVLAALAVIAPAFAFANARITDTVLHPWYVLACVPPLLILAAGNAGWIHTVHGKGRLAMAAALGAGAALWLATIWPVKQLHLRHAQQPMKEVVLHVRGGQFHPAYLEQENQVEFARFWTDLGVYDPKAFTVWSEEELRQREELAHELERPLFLAFAHRRIALSTIPELVDYVENSGRYKHVRDFFAVGEGQFNHHLFLYKGTMDMASGSERAEESP